MSEEGPTPDGRWIVINGRRWRASDPSIPQPLRAELVAELMDARRAVGAARRGGHPDAERAARRRVNDAKVALGERGEPWWHVPTDISRRGRIAAAIRTLARHRAPEGSTCPSDIARAVGSDAWRTLMPITRDVARHLAKEGTIEIRQKGTPLDPDQPWRGPIRIAARHQVLESSPSDRR